MVGLFSFLAVLAVAFEAPVAAAVFGAAAFYVIGHGGSHAGEALRLLLKNEPLRKHWSPFWPDPAIRLQMGDLKASAAAEVTAAVCSPCRACPW